MRASGQLCLAAAVAMTAGAIGARAASPIYSFETLYNSAVPPQVDPSGIRPDGFHPNGGGTTVAQDTVGATDGTHSLLYSMVAGATFTGAQTEVLDAATVDANTTAIALDLTIPQTGSFTGTFALLGISEFGNNPDAGMGLQVQTVAASEQNVALTPGTYHLTIPLIARTNPVTFDGNVTFASCFGSDPGSQLTPTSFEFYINKSSDSALTVYLDNVTAILAAPPVIPGDITGPGGGGPDGIVDQNDLNVVLQNFGNNAASFATGDIGGPSGSPDGLVDQNDLNIVLQNFGHVAGGGSGDLQLSPSLSVVPEPASAAVFVIAGMMIIGRRRVALVRGRAQ